MEKSETAVQRWQTILEHVDNAIMVIDADLRVDYVNARYYTMWGVSRDFILKRPTMADVIRECSRLGLYRAADVEPLIARRTRMLLEDSETFSLETPRTDGVVVEGYARRLPDGSFLLTFRDVTKHIEHLDGLNRIFESAPIAVIAMDGKGKIVSWNKRAEALLGWKSSEVFDRFLGDLFPPVWGGDLFRAFLHGDTPGGGRSGAEAVIKNRRGEFCEVGITAGPFSTIKESMSGWVIIVDEIGERKRMDLALRNSEETFRNLVHAAPIPIFVHISGYFVFLNPAAVALVGAERKEDLIGKEILQFLVPEDRALFGAALADLDSSSEIVNHFSLRILPLSGGERQVAATFLPIDYNGCSTRMAICLDVTEQRAAERALRESEEKFRAIFDQAFQFSGLLDLEGVVLDVNHSALEFIGAREEEVRGLPFWEAPWWRDLPSTQQAIRTAVGHSRNGEMVRFETVNRGRGDEKRYIDFSIKPVKNDVGEVVYLIPEGRDITERKEAEEALRRREADYRTLSHEFEMIFNGIPDSLTVWTDDLRLVWANRPTADYYRRPLEALVGRSCKEICAYDICNETKCEICCIRGSTQIDERMRKTHDGRTWGVKTFAIAADQDGGARVVRLASDLSERIRLREEATRASHLAALGELAAGVAHEVNNPTGLILLDLPVLRDAFRDALPILEARFCEEGDFPFAGLRYSQMRDQIPHLLEEMAEGAQRIKRIVDELKDFSHPTDPYQFERVDLNEVVAKAYSLLAGQMRKFTDVFTVRYAENAPTVRGNVHRLEQVIVNLLLNAGQALPDRSRSVEAEVLVRSKESRTAIVVRDQGCGIPPEHLQLITDPFFTTRREIGGTGLGLSVSSRIVQEHGGILHFDSQPAVGTTVTIELPWDDTEAS